jgi:hypothetical protein
MEDFGVEIEWCASQLPGSEGRSRVFCSKEVIAELPNDVIAGTPLANLSQVVERKASFL